MSTTHFEIVPDNTQSDGKLSYDKSGNPTIRIRIPDSDRHLIPGTVRLNGFFKCFRDTAENDAEATTGMRMNEAIGVYSIIDSLTFQNFNGDTIEEIENYNRFCSTYIPVGSSKQDSFTNFGTTALTMPNFEVQRTSVVNDQEPGSFSIPLVSGLMNGHNPLPLSSKWGIGGLEIIINLSPSANVFFSASTSSASFSTGFYELSKVNLTGETAIPDPDMLSQLESQKQTILEYNSIKSFYQTVNSTNAVLSMNLGLSKVMSIFGTFVPSAFINNLVHDGLATLYPMNSDASTAVIKQVIWQRAGERFPFLYNIDTLQQDDPVNEEADAQVVRNFMNAIKIFSDLGRTSVTPSNNTNIFESQLSYKDYNDGGSTAGIGVSYDHISNDGVSFKNTPLGLQLNVGLESDFPNALYLFALNKNTLIISNGNVQIVS